MNYDTISPGTKLKVKNALQNIYDAAENENSPVTNYIIDELVKINEALDITILM